MNNEMRKSQKKESYRKHLESHRLYNKTGFKWTSTPDFSREPVVIITSADRTAADSNLNVETTLTTVPDFSREVVIVVANENISAAESRMNPVSMPAPLNAESTLPTIQADRSATEQLRNADITSQITATTNRPRRRHAEVPIRRTHRMAMTLQDVENVEVHYLGEMRNTCRHCNALYFSDESNRRGELFLCCKYGEVKLPPLQLCPVELEQLLKGEDTSGRQFLDHIRTANSLFAMASFKARIPEDRNVNQGNWCFWVAGQIYHYTEPIPSQTNSRSVLNQYYFIDATEAIERRSTFIGDRLPPTLLSTLERMLRRDNPYVRSYMTMAEVIRRQRAESNDAVNNNFVIGFKTGMLHQTRNFEIPICRTDIAAVFEGDEPPYDVDLTVYSKSTGRQTELKNLNKLTDPMVYPLLFPKGEQGYDLNLQRRPRNRRTAGNLSPPLEGVSVGGDSATQNVGTSQQRRQRNVTIREFYRYRLMTRFGGDFSILHNSGKLFQQYIVDSWVRAESNDLWYLKQNQQHLRSMEASSLRQYLQARASEGNARVGKVVILPRTFIGGQRSKNRLFLDAMTIVARHGKPDLFITFTCNPHWREIRENLSYNQKWEHRPDLVCRVFHSKLLCLIDDIYNKQYFGLALNYMYAVEFQKRGLPHAHILLTLVPSCRFTTADEIDSAVCAAFPDPTLQPRLFGMIKTHSIHRPCGATLNPNAPCMKNGVCQKNYPKNFVETTTLVGSNPLRQPEYRRPNDGRGFVFSNECFIDNRRVVPHNKYLTAKYDCHINVECCGSMGMIRYLHKYVNKGPDYVTIQAVGETHGNVINWDEIKSYQDYRYVSATEAVWRLFQYQVSDRSHAVLVLPVHLPGRQQVYIDENDFDDNLLAVAGRPTKLDAWFTLNVTDFYAKHLLYSEIPESYVWNANNHTWVRRRQISKTIGCVAEVSPRDEERFYLRMLLRHIRGATSFENLKTVDGVSYETFLEACRARNMLADGQEYDRCLTEAFVSYSSYHLRKLFGLICVLLTTDAGDPMLVAGLWQSHKQNLCSDFVTRDGDSPCNAEKKALYHIKSIIFRITDGRYGMDVFGLPDINFDDPLYRNVHTNDYDFENDAMAETVPQQMSEEWRSLIENLNEEQLQVYDYVLTQIVESMSNDGQRRGSNVVYVDGPAGTGKTFLYNCIIKTVVQKLRRHHIAVAWTGIAAQLLYGGRTVHSAFRLPLQIEEQCVAGFPIEHEKSRIIKDAALIVWDEVSMTPRLAIDAVDRYLRDLCGQPHVPMGGKIILFGGDFRQLLPVLKSCNTAQIISSCAKSAEVWNCVKEFRLVQNMRARNAGDVGNENRQFAEYLLRIGEGKMPYIRMPLQGSPSDLIEMPNECVVSDMEQLISKVYGSPISADKNFLAGRAILSPTNKSVDEINSRILDDLTTDERTYYSEDTYMADEVNTEEELYIPVDVLNSINVGSLPPHELRLKKGAVVMLLRNIDLENSLCNGTRMFVVDLGHNLITVEVLTGSRKGYRTSIPKIHLLCSTGTNLPRPLKRFQFPVRLAFAITINKSQGQTLDSVGLYLDTPCFAHGQLYVAMSRVGCIHNLKMHITDSNLHGRFRYRNKTFTRNVVIDAVVNNMNNDYDINITRETLLNRVCGMLDNLNSVGLVAPHPRVITTITTENEVDDQDERVITQPASSGLIDSEQEADDDVDYENQNLPIVNPAPIPQYTDSQLKRRHSNFIQQGTSGLNWPISIAKRSYWWRPASDSESDVTEEEL